jgi:ribosomal protein S18 acetylase RimI-like enzyme
MQSSPCVGGRSYGLPVVIADPPAGLTARRPSGSDHAGVLLAQERWWGGLGGEAGAQQRAFLLPRLFFQHFADTSTLLEGADGALRAFLVGFVSQSQPEVGYIHFAGVDPALRRQGVARWLYARFFAEAGARGATVVRCITSPANRTSQAFHSGIGFEIDAGDVVVDGVAVQRDYDGPGVDRVTFTRRLAC